MQQLDQFYTKTYLAEGCLRFLEPYLQKITQSQKEPLYFIEPSVGNGDFYDRLPQKNRLGIDLVKSRKDFIEEDFLQWTCSPALPPRRQRIVIGNPPFGHRSQIAIAFFNKASEVADTIAFVLPVVFRKFFIHKQLNKDFQWIGSHDLPREAFYTHHKKNYSVNTEFQIWTRLKNTYKNRRLFAPPPITHEDFIMYQYNNTQEALKVFENDFDFAVPSQGWQDYTRREHSPDKCEKQKQWILFKTRAQRAYNRLYKEINFTHLAMKNTTAVPGFRKNDVVQEYITCYSSPKKRLP